MFTSPENGVTPSPSSNGPRSSVSQSRASRQKRHQVARACDACRLHRIKCDSQHPCRNCRNKGSNCTVSGRNAARSLPESLRELDALRSQVKDLERQLQDKDVHTSRIEGPLPSSSPDSRARDSPLADSGPPAYHGARRIFWEGIHTRSALSKETQYYGPSSSFYFIGRMSSFLTTALAKPTSDVNMQPNSACKTFASPTVPRTGDLGEMLVSSDVPAAKDCLIAIQEEYFLSLFWESYHCTYQILNEEDFKKHYKSLWDASGTSRRPSSLVDIVLALSIQLGVGLKVGSSLSSDQRSDVNSNDATIAGRSFYRRCQALLASELESPSISTLQCQLLSLVYLCNASFQNMAHGVSASAMRTAHILGLHLEPSGALPIAEREFRKRLWWTVYAVEIKTSMKLGRPIAAPISQTNCSLPSDDHEIARLSGSTFAPVDEKATWHTYSVQCTKLILAVHTIYNSFYDKSASVLSSIEGRNLYTSQQALETLASFLQSKTSSLQTWLNNLPPALQTQRQNNGKPFSTGGSSPQIEPFAPLWLQRQRLILELLYHNLSLNLYRPFICFPSPSAPSPDHSTTASRLSQRCLSHALTITTLMHHTLTTTSILSGWHEAFQWQWNAALSIAGFLFANSPPSPSPSSDPAPFTAAQNGLEQAIQVFDIMGSGFAVAASAADVARGLVAKLDALRNQGGAPAPRSTDSTEGMEAGDGRVTSLTFGLSGSSLNGFEGVGEVDGATDFPTAPTSALDPGFSSFDTNMDMDIGMLEGSMGLDFTVDAGLDTGFEAIWAGNLFETWGFAEEGAGEGCG